MSATLPWISWNSPIDWPNCLRSWMYGTTLSITACMMPIGPAGEHRALVVEPAHQHLRAAVQRAEHVLGRHLDVLEHQLAGVAAAHAELVELLRDRKPFMPFSIRNAVTPRAPSCGSVFA
jgi:hypothetical protein